MAAVFGRYGTAPRSFGATFWNPGFKTEKTAKKREKTGQKWARYGLTKRVRVADLFVMDRYQEGLELIELALASHAGNAKVQAGLGSKAADVRNRLQALVDASEPEPEPRPGLGEDAATPRPQAVKLAVDVLKHAARTHDLVARGDVRSDFNSILIRFNSRLIRH